MKAALQEKVNNRKILVLRYLCDKRKIGGSQSIFVHLNLFYSTVWIGYQQKDYDASTLLTRSMIASFVYGCTPPIIRLCLKCRPRQTKPKWDIGHWITRINKESYYSTKWTTQSMRRSFGQYWIWWRTHLTDCTIWYRGPDTFLREGCSGRRYMDVIVAPIISNMALPRAMRTPQPVTSSASANTAVFRNKIIPNTPPTPSQHANVTCAWTWSESGKVSIIRARKLIWIRIKVSVNDPGHLFCGRTCINTHPVIKQRKRRAMILWCVG